MKYVSIQTCNATHEAVKDDLRELKVDVKEIKDNHLTHIQNDVTDLKSKMRIITAVSSITASALVMALIKIIMGG